MIEVNIVWAWGPAEGRIEVSSGRLLGMEVVSGNGHTVPNDGWRSGANGSLRLRIAMEADSAGGGRGLVGVESGDRSFSFFAGDATSGCPIYIPAYGVAVTAAEDLRSYEEIRGEIESKRLKTNLQRIDEEPEESFEQAGLATRNQPSPIWQGVGRDTRIFESQVRGRASNNFWKSPLPGMELQWDWVQPRQCAEETGLPESEGRPVRYTYMYGRGIGCIDGVSRKLEDGALPILHTTVTDDDIVYRAVSFVSFEARALVPGQVDGTHYLIADGYGYGHMHSEDMKRQREALLREEETSRSKETTVFYFRVEAENTGKVPRYAWFKNVVPNAGGIPYDFDGATGFAQYGTDRIYSVSKLNGKPLPAEETAVLIQPGESASFEFYLPHEPVSRKRAMKLIGQDFGDRLSECCAFWHNKLSEGAQIRLPEPRIHDMIRAGLLHTDLIFYGQEPNGTLVPAIGIYTAIGSESSPIVQFMDTMGRNGIARRGLQFFLDKQHEDGLMQNFGGYMLETGAALWSLGEHYRYTRDDAWVREIQPKLLKAFDYLLRWRRRNETEELSGGQGYGMLEGKTADPEDCYHSFMLSGYAYLGLSRLAEMLAATDAELAYRIRGEAERFKRDIRESFARAVARSPVIPLGDGTWVPAAPPWVEYRGPLALYAEGGNWYTHGSFMSRDSMLGPMYLIYQEVIAPDEQLAEFLVHAHHELMTTRNTAFSQPYYSMHPWVHLKRGEVKPFLKAYYNTFAGLADRETYSFWEHYYQVSPHKTHEEGWFLMQTRWMLYLEEGDTLKLLPGIPRRWLEEGKAIELRNVSSYFGSFTLRVSSNVDSGTIAAEIVCTPGRGLRSVLLRLPHPERKRPVRVTGGSYRQEDEAVYVESFDGAATIVLEFK